MIFVLLKNGFKFVGVIVVTLFIDWVVGPLPGVPCTSFKPNELFYFGSCIYVVISLSWVRGGRFFNGVLNILC